MHQITGVGCLVLAHQAGTVNLDGAVADAQGLADFLGSQTAVRETEEGHARSRVIRGIFLKIVISRDNVIIMGDNNEEMLWLQNV